MMEQTTAGEFPPPVIQGVATAEGLPYAQMDALMTELLADKSETETGPNGAEAWDKMSLLTGGFVPVGSIFWARPPKLRSQQEILMALREMRQVGQAATESGTQEEGAWVDVAIRQAAIAKTLALKLFFVYGGAESAEGMEALLTTTREGRLQKSGFRQATEEELVCDETGLTPLQIKDALMRLMAMSEDAAGNA